MLETAKAVAKLEPDALKIHMLHIAKGTCLAKIYEEKGAKKINNAVNRAIYSL